MDLEQYFLETKRFNEAALPFNLYQLVSILRNSLVSLKSLRNNITGQNVATQITNIKNQITSQKENVTNAMALTLNASRSMPVESDLTEQLVGENQIALISSLSQNIDINDTSLLNSVDSVLLKIITTFNFFNATNQAFGNGDIREREENILDTLKVIFENDAYISDLKELSGAANEWSFIVNSFARLVGSNDTKAEVLSITKGSLILTLLADKDVIIAISACMTMAMKAIIQSLKIKAQQLEIQKLNTPNVTKLIELLEADAKIDGNKESKKIAGELLLRFFPEQNNDTKSEVKSFLIKAIKKILTFAANGGKVKPKLIGPTDNQKKEIKELAEKNIEAKVFQSAIESLKEGKKILLIEEGDEEIEVVENVVENNPNDTNIPKLDEFPKSNEIDNKTGGQQNN